jgi:predicted DCC family thiol-disulfide oxidoreductase YuxK
VPAARVRIPETRPILVFDGDCAFCTTWVNRLRELLPRFPEALPFQWIDYAELGLDEHDVTHYAWYVSPTRQLGGHLAFSALLRAQRGPWWRFAGWLLATPPYSWIAALGYRFIARNRHRLPGGTPACALPPVERG